MAIAVPMRTIAGGMRINDLDPADGHAYLTAAMGRAGRVAMALRMIARTSSRSAPTIGNRGARVVSEPSPVSDIASLMYCTSLTLVSRCSRGVYQRYSSRASRQRPDAARSHSSRFSFGNALTSPEI